MSPQQGHLFGHLLPQTVALFLEITDHLGGRAWLTEVGHCELTSGDYSLALFPVSLLVSCLL